MKKAKSIKFLCALLLGTLAIMLLIINSISSVSAYYAAPQKLIVKGFSEINFKPDTASVCVGVETVNSDLTTAQKENASTMEKIINTLTDNGINKNDIRTTSYNIFKQHNFNNNTEFFNTQVSNRICFKTTNIDGLSELITKLTESGANVFGGITFELSDSSKAYNQALAKAIENAKSKAKVLAPNTNIDVMEILEEYSYCSPCYYDNYAKAELTSNNIMQGDVTVCANVKVIFECNNAVETSLESKTKNKTDAETNQNNKTGSLVKSETNLNKTELNTNLNTTTNTSKNNLKSNKTDANSNKTTNVAA